MESIQLRDTLGCIQIYIRLNLQDIVNNGKG